MQNQIKKERKDQEKKKRKCKNEEKIKGRWKETYKGEKIRKKDITVISLSMYVVILAWNSIFDLLFR